MGTGGPPPGLDQPSYLKGPFFQYLMRQRPLRAGLTRCGWRRGSLQGGEESDEERKGFRAGLSLDVGQHSTSAWFH